MRNAIRYIFGVLILLYGSAAFAQQYTYRHYTVKDGLAQNQVTTLYLDKQGFVWVGTKGGASRFDGMKFKNFTMEDGLTDNYIERFLELNGTLFCLTLKGVSVYQNEKFNIIAKFPKSNLNRIVLSSDSSKAYVSFGNKILMTNGKTHEIIYTHDTKDDIYNLVLDPGSNNLIFSVEKKLFCLEPGKKPQIIFDNSHYKLFHDNHRVYFIAEVNQTDVDKNGLYKLVGRQAVKIFDNKNSTLGECHFIASKGHIFMYNNNTAWIEIDTVGHIVDRDSLYNRFFYAFLCDKEGNYWLGSETGIFCTQSFAFRNYGEKSGVPPYIWSILENPDSSIVFVGYNGELCTLKNNKISVIPRTAYPFSRGDFFYMNGLCTSRGVWMLPTGNGYVMTYDGKRFEKITLNVKDDFPAILAVHEDTADQRMYFGTTIGLIVYDLNKKTYTVHPTGGNNVLFIESDKYHRKWVCTNAKVYLFEKDSIREMNYPGFKNEAGVVSCKRDSRGNMWVAGKTGLYLYTWKNYIKIVPEEYYFISLFRNRNIIAGNVNGFLYIDLDAFYSYNPDCCEFFDRNDGFIGIECGQNGTCIDRQGNVWIPTSESVVKFMPGRLTKNRVPPFLILYSFEISGRNLKWELAGDEFYDKNQPIGINHGFNNIRISYRGVSYSCPEEVVYKTRLSGYNEAWSEPSTDNSVVYTNLSHGNYVLEIMACNADGVWTEKPMKVHFVIHAAFWQTEWFITIISLIFAFVIGIVVYLIIRAKRKKELQQLAIEKELISLQVKTINAQIDPHFVFNAITAIGAEVQVNNVEKAYSYFVKVSNLLRNSLQNNDKILRPLYDEIDFINNYLTLQKFRFGERFDYTVNVSDHVDMKFEIPKMCVQTFVENALKHGLEHKKSLGRLKIEITMDNRYLVAEITDDGVGREKAGKLNIKSTGIGLKTLKKFFDIYNSYNTENAGFEITDLFDKMGEAAGTTVKLTIPLSYKFVI
ncbi:MAG TPA: histidine kinase [Bacteroidales bacterium]|nr:histidine kinase [Bacteroidales bacterium]HQN15708.1 histidine kinase [Bacteroidales bacterium]HQP15301.1 histidine kinase [Bacteroidales bacterium]